MRIAVFCPTGIAALAFIIGAWNPPVQAQISVPAVGAVVPDITLKDVHRRPVALRDFHDKKALVIVFIGNECPLSNLYVPTLVRLHREYASQGVQFLAINANAQDDFLEVSAYAQERDLPFPVLKDFDQEAADALGASRTPEAFVLDAGRVIRYHGRIDDQYGIGYRRAEPRWEYLKNAVHQILAGKPVVTPQTDVPGCVIGRPKTASTKGEITYAKQISRILQQRCQTCHRPDQAGPFSLLSYSDARLWADTMREVVTQQRMPPWYADPRYGHFANERRLTPSEKETLLAWIDQGCPEGDPKDLPAPASFPEGWTIGKPDMVLSIPKDFQVPATGIVPYQYFTVDPGFHEDRWIQAAEAKPGNRAVVHHIAVFIDLPGKKTHIDPDGTAASLVNWTPGDQPCIYPSGIAKRLPAGATLTFQVHYTPKGIPQTDRSSVGIIFAKQPPARAVVTNWLANTQIRIPPRASKYQERVTYVFPDDARILQFTPHMHTRGVSAQYRVTYPDGRSEMLLSVPDYDFNWQSAYRFAEPLRVPKGTKLTWIATWDNSAANLRNPDPSQEVRWGDQTWNEMMSGWMELVWERPHVF